jgi:cytochrome c peroxidase
VVLVIGGCGTDTPVRSDAAIHEPLEDWMERQLGGRNAPTVFNAASHIAQFWDGRARTIEDQATQPIMNPREMAILDVGCMGCHTGPQVGGTMFQRVGVIEPWPNQTDRGRTAITNNPSDVMVFEVPGLNNIVKTGRTSTTARSTTCPPPSR